MRYTILVASIAAVAASILTTAAISGSFFGAGTASSANTPIEAAAAVRPGGLEGILQGDVDCRDGVTPVDSLKTLRHDAGLSVQQDEPCPDIATVIPVGDDVPGPQGPQGDVGPAGPQGEQGPPGISGYEIVTEINQGACETQCAIMTTATCPAGKNALGGGSLYTATDGQFEHFGSGPSDERTWGSQWYITGASYYEFWDSVVCANVAD